MLIALTLHCLVLTHEIFSLDYNVPHHTFKKFALHRESEPHMEIWTAPTHMPQQHDADTLPALLGQILEKVQRTLYYGNPDDWPMLLCTLCMLHLVAQNYNLCGFLNSRRRKR